MDGSKGQRSMYCFFKMSRNEPKSVEMSKWIKLSRNEHCNEQHSRGRHGVARGGHCKVPMNMHEVRGQRWICLISNPSQDSGGHMFKGKGSESRIRRQGSLRHLKGQGSTHFWQQKKAADALYLVGLCYDHNRHNAIVCRCRGQCQKRWEETNQFGNTHLRDRFNTAYGNIVWTKLILNYFKRSSKLNYLTDFRLKYFFT